MIRTVTTLLVVLLLWTPAMGQLSRFEIGIEGGPSLVSLRGNSILESMNESTIAYSGGVTFQYNFPKLVSLRTNIAFERKGAVSKSIGTDLIGAPIGEITTRTNMDYVTIPLLARLGIGNKAIFFINAGPYVGFLMKQTSERDAFAGFPASSTDNTANFERVDMGMTSGLGCSIPIKDNFLVTIEARHNLGLYNTSRVPVVSNGKIQTNATNVLVGFAYKLGRRTSSN